MKDGAISDLNWNLLRTFYTIAEEESITRAAKRLNLRQPSVTAALQKLEAQLGCQLVFRDSRHFELTLRGAKIHQECADIFRSVDRISELSKDSDEESHGEARLQVISSLVSPLLDEALRLFHQRHPSMTMRIEVANSQAILHNLYDEQPGTGICLLTKPVPDLDCKYLFREEFSVFCGAEHPLYGQEKVSVRALKQEPFIAFNCADEGRGLEPMDALRDSAKLGTRIIGSSSNVEEVRRMIVAGLGIGVLPLNTATHEMAAGLLWPLRVMDQSIGADVFMLRNPRAANSAADQRFHHIVEELLHLYPDLG